MVGPYQPEPLTDFSDAAADRQMREALRQVESEWGRTYSLIIDGVAVDTDACINSVRPDAPSIVVGRVAKATKEHVDTALDAAWQAFGEWSRSPASARSAVLYRAAAIMRRRKFTLAAWEVFEAGKTWSEADGDVAEAIDFLEYYGRQMERLAAPVPVIPLAGESNTAFYIPLGVGAIIPPWNFPLAILTGMTAGAVAAGNCVLLKPASATPVIAAQFVDILRQAGLPPGVVNFVPGDGGVIGDHLVAHRLTRFISFTGSREVGLGINRLAADPAPGQRWIKRVVAELGGKDAIVVDETADLDAAASGIVASAFGFQGQKCSACSRAIIVDAVYDAMVERIVRHTEALRMGPPADPAVAVGPVIDARAFSKIHEYIAWGREHAKILTGGEVMDPVEGYFIRPTVFGDVAPGSKLEQEEIFGPVLAIIRAQEFDDALRIANDTVYGLTGSLYSARRDRLERARTEFHVGNLYFNRKSTGAVVGAHPFGGFNLSGTDSKTGSPDYLLQFMQMKAVSEQL